MLIQKSPEIVEYASELFCVSIGHGRLKKQFGIKNSRMAKSLEEYMIRDGGGKAIRASYVFAGAIAAGGLKSPVYSNPIVPLVNKYLPAALSIQFDHNWFLMHDDPEDGSEKRRGGPAYHIQHGLDFAINDGDYLKLIAEKCFIKSKKLWGLDTLFRMTEARLEMLEDTVHGQNYEFEKRKDDLNETTLGDVEYIRRYKSSYTNWVPVRYAYIIAGRPDSEIMILKEPLLKITDGFQGMDDVLNLLMKKGDDMGVSSSNRRKVGKDLYGDLDEGKRTGPLILAHERCDSSERTFLEENIRNGPFDPRFENRRKLDLETKREILGIMKKYNTIEDSKKMAIHSVEEGNRILEQLIGQPRVKEIIEINNYCVYREN